MADRILSFNGKTISGPSGIGIVVVKEPEPVHGVTIGGRTYRTVTIGNQEWLAENLDYKFNVNGSQIPVGQSGVPSTPAAWYYNNNETDYGIDGTYKCGLLYNWYAAKYLDDNKATLLPAGWHVPSSTELTALLNATGGSGTTTVNTKLKAANNSVTSNWPSNWNGTDDYEFTALPGGERSYNGSFSSINDLGQFCGSDVYSVDDCYSIGFGRYSTIVSVGHNQKYKGYSIRLVKSLA